MKQEDIKVGHVYWMRVNRKFVPVRITQAAKVVRLKMRYFGKSLVTGKVIGPFTSSRVRKPYLKKESERLGMEPPPPRAPIDGEVTSEVQGGLTRVRVEHPFGSLWLTPSELKPAKPGDAVELVYQEGLTRGAWVVNQVLPKG